MEMMEMISKALNEAVEQKVAEKMQEIQVKQNLETLQEKIDFVKELNRAELFSILNYLAGGRGPFDDWLDDYYERRLDDDCDVIRKDDLEVSDVADAGLLEDCFERYVEDNDERSIIKELVDRL